MRETGVPKRMRKMTLKQRFFEEHKQFKSTQKSYSFDEIKDQSPDNYDAHKMMVGCEKRCDNFVLCGCTSSITGIYVIEVKGVSPSAKKVKEQLSSGANFIERYIQTSDKFDFLPVLIAQGIPSSRHTPLNSTYVFLRGKKRNIRHFKPGAPLEKIT